jgi:hypothetical protein
MQLFRSIIGVNTIITCIGRCLSLTGGEGGKLERMDSLLELIGEKGIDRALPFDAALARKSSGDDLDPEMGLAALACAGMPGMTMGIVNDREAAWREPSLEFRADAIGHRHRTKVWRPRARVKRMGAQR